VEKIELRMETLETVEKVELKTEENNETLKTEESSLNRQVRRWKKKDNSSKIASEKSLEELARSQNKNEGRDVEHEEIKNGTKEMSVWKGVQTLFKPKSKLSRK